MVGVCDGWCGVMHVVYVVCVVRLHTSLQERTGAQRGRQRFHSYLNERDQKNTHTHTQIHTRAHTHKHTHLSRQQRTGNEPAKKILVFI